MFDIVTCRDFLAKLNADFDDFLKQQDSARLALNCIVTAYHLHEWVWGDWLKTDHAVWKQLGIRDKETFIAWIEHECPGFKTIQDLANGAKHFIRKQDVQTRHVGGFGMGPYGVGPYGASYLLIDYGADAGAERWKTAKELLESAVTFWNGFFDKHYPTERQGIAEVHDIIRRPDQAHGDRRAQALPQAQAWRVGEQDQRVLRAYTPCVWTARTHGPPPQSVGVVTQV